MGHRFMKMLNVELKGVLFRYWNSEHLLVFTSMILPNIYNNNSKIG